MMQYGSELYRLFAFSDQLYKDRLAPERLHTKCIPAVPPIRRLPTEILIEIFKHREKRNEDQAPADNCLLASQELRRVAGGDLSAFSQVCSQWRQVVLYTPTLWTHVALDLSFWTNGIDLRTCRAFLWIVPLLEVALARGREVPLCVDLNATGRCHPRLLQTLATSARRWRSATLYVESDLLTNLGGMAGNLPLLETVRMTVVNESPETLADLAKLFCSAPRLHTVEFCGPLSVVAYWPVEQFRRCLFCSLGPEDIRPLVAFMDRFTNAELHLELDFEAFQDSELGSLDLDPVVSSIVEIDISARDTGHQTQVSQRVLGEIFDALTLPGLERLHLCGATKSGNPVRWPHIEGTGLLKRCGSRTTLISLHLDDVIITDSELLECLAGLPQLQNLRVADHPGLDGLVEKPRHHLITDRLLKQLTPPVDSPAQCLVPNLEILDFKTFGKFTDTVFFEFAVGRATLAGHKTLECVLDWIPGWPCELTVPTHVHGLKEWMGQGGKINLTWENCDD
ncbi:hypothetical protein C8R45DRAFT_1136174 [Mycena sanguinolenta]|nr:hypothetical protein C8R45DRAFT_1136174 [Mycena sanguinolenta]